MNHSTWIDIGYAIKNNMISFPGDPEPVISNLESIDQGDHANVALLKMSAHTGTHVDALLHFDNKGKAISQVPMDVKTGRSILLKSITLIKLRWKIFKMRKTALVRLNKETSCFAKTFILPQIGGINRLMTTMFIMPWMLFPI